MTHPARALIEGDLALARLSERKLAEQIAREGPRLHLIQLREYVLGKIAGLVIALSALDSARVAA